MSQVNPTDGTLVQLQIIHRHGARTPTSVKAAQDPPFPPVCSSSSFSPFLRFTPSHDDVYIYPTPPKPLSSSPSSCYAGQLTPIGAAQMYALGARLRQRYASFLPSFFHPDIVKVRSTAIKRTVESATAVVSGMFPGSGTYPLDIRPRDKENMVGFRKRCRRLGEIQKKAFGNWVPTEGIAEIMQNAGKGEWTSARGLMFMRDMALAYRENGVGNWLWHDVVEAEAEHIVVTKYGRGSWGLAVGGFMEELLDNAEKRKEIPWKIKVFSGHDTTLLPLMGIIEDGAWRGVPKFGADVVLEVWERDGKEDAVRVRYEGEEVVVKGCESWGGMCPISVFGKALRKRIPDTELECLTVEERRLRKKAMKEMEAAEGEEGMVL